MNARHHDHSVTPRLMRDRLWHELTIAANQAFEDGDVEQAEKLYRHALAEAEKLFSTQDITKTVIPLPAILNIAFHNLARFAAHNGDENECTGLLIRAFQRLVGSALQPATPLVLRLSCIQHLKYTLAELVEHLKHDAMPEPNISYCIEQFREAVLVVRHAAAHAERAKDTGCCGHCALAN